MKDISRQRFMDLAAAATSTNEENERKATQATEAAAVKAATIKRHQADWENRVLPLLAQVASEATQLMGASLVRVAVRSISHSPPLLGEAVVEVFLNDATKPSSLANIRALPTGHVQIRHSATSSNPISFASLDESAAAELVGAVVEKTVTRPR